MIYFFSWFLIPCITLLIPGRENWLTSNFSVVSCESPARYLLILWAAVTGGFFRFLVKRTIGQPALSMLAKRELSLTDLAVCFLFLSVLIPYRPDRYRILSAIHVILAFTASALFYLILMSLDLRMYFRFPGVFSALTALLIGALTVSVLLFFLADCMISSTLEVFFTIFSCHWLSAFHKKVSSLEPLSP